MPFQVLPLDAAQFAPLYGLSEAELARRGVRRLTADASPGYPCRVSLTHAEIGERVLLMNYQHQAEGGPYRASHAIFVREGAASARPAEGTVPDVLRCRHLSVRAFDRRHDMVGAHLVEGDAVASVIATCFADPGIAYLHLHTAGPGCYAAKVVRAGREQG